MSGRRRRIFAVLLVWNVVVVVLAAATGHAPNVATLIGLCLSAGIVAVEVSSVGEG